MSYPIQERTRWDISEADLDKKLADVDDAIINTKGQLGLRRDQTIYDLIAECTERIRTFKIRPVVTLSEVAAPPSPPVLPQREVRVTTQQSEDTLTLVHKCACKTFVHIEQVKVPYVSLTNLPAAPVYSTEQYQGTFGWLLNGIK